MGRVFFYTAATSLLAVSAVLAHRQFNSGSPSVIAEDQPSTAAVTLMSAQPYLLEEPYVGWYRAEQPPVDAGWLLVLQVPAELAEIHQRMDPVLYVGEQTAERWNSGQPTGQLVVTVPAARGENGFPLPLSSDLRTWFGTSELPERVDADRIAKELQLAIEAGIPAISTSELESALQRGGEVLRVPDHHGLGYAVADLVEAHSPTEQELIETLRIEPTR